MVLFLTIAGFVGLAMFLATREPDPYARPPTTVNDVIAGIVIVVALAWFIVALSVKLFFSCVGLIF